MHRPVLLLLLALAALALAGSRPAAGAALDTVFAAGGEADNDWFGVAVAGVGDVDGDGYSDLLVGAYANDAGGPDAGRAYLFLGGAVPDTLPDLAFTGVQDDYLGTAVAGIGDMNGDGHLDFAVGAPANDRAGLDVGTVYVHFGGPGLDAIPDLVLTGVAPGGFFGQAVAGAGDLDGDGYADLAVGAWKDATAGKDAGRVFVYRGGAPPDTVPDLVLDGEAPYDNFGWVVAGAGDLDGDGYADLVVGAPFHGADNGGRIYVYRGGATLDPAPDLVAGGPPFGNLGFSVAGGGDLDGDGYDDLLAGAVFAGPTAAGRAYVFTGAAMLDSVPDLVLDGESARDRFGFAVAAAGDLDGDGFGDFVVGAPYVWLGEERSVGRIYVHHGARVLDAVPEQVLTGATRLGNLGYALAPAGDLDGDRRADVVAGAPLAASGPVTPGTVTAFTLGATTATLLAMLRIEPREGAIEIAWRLVSGARDGARLERAAAAAGPWREVASAWREADEAWHARDADVEPGRTYHYRVLAAGAAGLEIAGAFTAAAGLSPPALALEPVRPNPASGPVTLGFALPRAARVDLTVRDLQGRAVARPLAGALGAGRHRVLWDGRSRGARVPPGIYFAVLATAEGRRVRRFAVGR